MPTGARPATDDDLDPAIGCLSRAFYDDRIEVWLIPDEAQRRQAAQDFFTMFATTCFAHGSPYVTDDGNGAALWFPPEVEVVPEDDDTFGPRLVATAGSPESTRRSIALFTMLGEHHPTEPHWYLPFIGVDPAHQGRGLGSTLLRAALARVDAEGAPAYLEASDPANARLYLAHGFEIRAELQVEDSPILYAMWRDAQR